jgi:hypothetical protein
VGEGAEFDVDRLRDVAGLVLAALTNIDHGADDVGRSDEWDAIDRSV